MALLILALLQRIFLMSSLMLLLVWLIFFMVLIKLLPILGTISGKTVKLMVLALICLGNNRQDRHPPNCMFSCLQILEAFLWFVLITLLNVTLIILTLSVSRLLNLLLRLVAFLLFLNPQCLASISRWITASSSWKRFCLFVCRALSSIMVICMLTAIRLLLTFVMSLYLSGKKFRVGIKSNISTNRNNLISGVDRCIHLNAMKKTTITSINRQTIKI